MQNNHIDQDLRPNISRPLRAIALTFPNGYREERHTHSRAELLCADSGTIRVTTERSAWIVPPHRAIWIPPEWPHHTAALTDARMHALFIRVDACPADAPSAPRVIRASPLLRELVHKAATMPVEYDESGRDGRVVALLLDEIEWAPVDLSAMPTLRDSRILAVERALVANPGDSRTLDEWANWAGASSRTLGRLFREEAGMSFGRWREQLRALTAISRLIEGLPVTALASEFGYDTPGAFTAMFKRVLGVTPSQYLHEAKQGRGASEHL